MSQTPPPEALSSILARHPVPVASPEEAAAEDRRRLAEIERVREEARRAFPGWLRGAGVGFEYTALRYDESKIPDAMRTWAATFPDGLFRRGGVLISGDNGGGKTAAACWLIGKVYWSGTVVPEPDGIQAIFAHPTALFVKAHEIYRAIEQRRYGWTEDLLKPHLLVIDNVGTAYEGFGKGAAEMEWVADKRWEAHRPTVVTTTLWPSSSDPSEDTFQRRYPSLYDRTTDAAGVGLVSMNRESLRRVPS